MTKSRVLTYQFKYLVDKVVHFTVSLVLTYTQSPIIKNGLIRNDAEILGIFKERRLSRSKLRNA